MQCVAADARCFQALQHGLVYIRRNPVDRNPVMVEHVHCATLCASTKLSCERVKFQP